MNDEWSEESEPREELALALDELDDRVEKLTAARVRKAVCETGCDVCSDSVSLALKGAVGALKKCDDAYAKVMADARARCRALFLDHGLETGR